MRKRIISFLLACVTLCSIPINVYAIVMPLIFSQVQGTFYGGHIVYEEYIYAPSRNEGVYIIDASNPEELKKVAVAECAMPADRGIAILGDFLYAQENEKIVVFDISKPEKPKKIGTTALAQGGRMAAYNNTLVVGGTGLLQFYDITDPKNINLLSSMTNPNPGWYYGVAMNETHVYYIDSKFNFTVVDYTDRSKPEIKKQMAIQNETGFADVYYPVLEGDIFYGGPMNEGAFYAIDVSDPLNPKMLTQMALDIKIGGFTKVGDKAYMISSLIGGSKLLRYDIVNDKDFVEEFSYSGEGVAGLCLGVIEDRYIVYNDYGTIRCLDLEGNIDTSGMPVVPNEAVVLGENEVTKTLLPFEDTKEHWAEAEISDLYNRGIVTGVTANRFEPERVINRAEFCTLLAKTLGITIEQYRGEFADVKTTDWYSDVIYSCVANGLLTSDTIKNNNARPTEPITREEMAVAVKAAFELAEKEMPADKEVEINDAESISDWAKDAVTAVCKAGIMVGDDAQNFNPLGETKRAEAVAVISRLISALYGETEEATFLDNNKYDIATNIEAQFDAFSYVEKMPYDTETPQILRVSDAISPDELFNIYGEGLARNAEVYITSTSKEKPTGELDTRTALKCDVVGFDDEDTEHYIVCKTPESMEPGSYYVWVKNDAGFANPVYLNGARAQWIDRDEAAMGQKMRIIGRNLDGREFDAPLATSVAFIKDGKATNGEIVSINPYCIEVIPPVTMEEGEYTIAVTNDANEWFELEEDKTIYIKNEIEDPFDLQMSWADKFNYAVKADITKEPYNAPNDGSKNVSHILQQAIDDVHAQGGGIVYIPEGKYKVAAIDVPANIIIMGDGMEKTILEYSNIADIAADESTPHLGNYMFHSKEDGITEGKHGIYKFQITLDPNCPAPDHYVWFGTNSWGDDVADMDLRETIYVFMKEIKLNTPMVRKENDGRAFGSVQKINSHFLMEDCIFYGAYSTATTQLIGKYSYMINTNTTSAIGNTYINGGRCILEGNEMNRHFKYSTIMSNTQGMFFRDHAYVTENIVRGTGMPGTNDGELFCGEIYMGGTKLKGTVVEADAQSLTYDPATINNQMDTIDTYKDLWDVEKHAYNDGWYVIIANGTGLGQYRRVKSIDQEENKIILDDKDWTILPDETSFFAIVLPLHDMTIYNNYANTGAKGCWLFGDSWDSVVAKNNLIDVEGCFNYTSNARGSVNSGMFNRFEGNKTVGYSNKAQACGIGAMAGMETGLGEYVQVYGVEVKNNDMTGGREKGEVIGGTEAPPVDGIYFVNSIWKEPKNPINTIKACLIEGNTVRDMETGITVGQDPRWEGTFSPARAYSDKVYCKDNTFENVEKQYVDKFNVIVEID